MGALDLSIPSLLLFLIFLAPVLYIGKRLNLNISRPLITGIIRMSLQLGLVGIYLEFIFRFNSPLVNTVYLLLMIAVACQSILKSSRLRLKTFFLPLFLSLVIPFSLMLLFFNGCVARIDNLFDAKYMVPVGGMILGNCLRCIIVGLGSFYSGIKDNEKAYLFTLGLYNNRLLAVKLFLQKSIVAGITPTLASMATIGLVSLPGMMTGQILGGSIPIVAVKYQIAIMFSIFYTEFFSLILSLLFSIKTAFTPRDVLEKNIFRRH
ncbi:MAG: ABC transporter permease [Desulfobacterales bacterium]|nr:ABC transporter permease [Desulfobacterales bacterium]